MTERWSSAVRGSTGNAWLIVVVASLFEAGLDVTQADLIIGTSTGSTAAAQIASSVVAVSDPELETALPLSRSHLQLVRSRGPAVT